MCQRHDVIVVGLGGTGSAAAHRLAERGMRVLGLDQFARPHEREAGDTRIIRNAYPDTPSYVPMLVRAWELWRRLERASGLELLRADGGLMIGPGGGRLVGETLRATEQWGIPVEVLGASDIARRFPGFRPDDDDLAVYDPWAGSVRLGAAVAAQTRQARRFGADLRFGERVLEWDRPRAGRGVRVRTDAGTYLAERLVLCPGAWAPEVVPDLGIELRVRRHPRARLRPAGGVDGHPVSIWEDRDGRQVCVLPADRGSGGMTALAHHGSACTPADTADHADGDRLDEHLARKLPGRAAAEHAAPVLSTHVVDGHFVLGDHPHHEGVTVACGMSDHGCGLVPVIGEILADLVLDSSTMHPVELFTPDEARARDVTASRT